MGGTYDIGIKMKRLARLLTAVLLSILVTGNPCELNLTPSV